MHINEEDVVDYIITGASSFIGSHLSHLIGQSRRVVATASKPLHTYTGLKKERLEYATTKSEYAPLDIRDISQIENLLESHPPLHWIHHAGYATDYRSKDYDVNTGFNINTLPLFKLIPLLKKYKVQSLLVTGSAMEYGFALEGLNETRLASPTTPYGLSKLFETQTALYLSKAFEFPTAVLRVFNPFGILDYPDKLIPLFTNKLISGESVFLNSPQLKLDFIPVETLCRIYQNVAENLDYNASGIFDLSINQHWKLIDIVNIIVKTLKVDEELVKINESSESHLLHQVSDSKKINPYSPNPLPICIENELINYILKLRESSKVP